MKRWKNHWEELLPHEKRFQVAAIISIIAVVVVFIFDIMDMLGVVPVSFDLFIISGGLLAVSQACEAVVCWRKERNFASACMMVAICVGLSTVRAILKLFI